MNTLKRIKLKLFNKKIEAKPFFTKDILQSEKIEVGDFTYGTPKILDWGEGAKLKIGKFCSISEDVTIFLGGNHRTDWISTYPFNTIPHFNNEGKNITGHPKTKGDVIIGNDVWIGWGAVILSGVKIGNGAVIGAYAMVTKDVLPYEIVGGNPAKHIKFRFNEETILMLTKAKWWDLPEDKIKKLIPFLCAEDMDGLKKLLSL